MKTAVHTGDTKFTDANLHNGSLGYQVKLVCAVKQSKKTQSNGVKLFVRLDATCTYVNPVLIDGFVHHFTDCVSLQGGDFEQYPSVNLMLFFSRFKYSFYVTRCYIIVSECNLLKKDV